MSDGYRAELIFDSRNEEYRSPAGALRLGRAMNITIRLREDLAGFPVELVLICDKTGERRGIEMTPSAEKRISETEKTLRHMPSDATEESHCGYVKLTASVTPEDTGLYWYYFKLDGEYGPFYAGKRPGGVYITHEGEPESWQLTVYDRKYEVPSWICGGVYYHIFVDRFCHSGEYVLMDGKVTRTDWGGEPVWQADPNGRIKNNDFFGGNLKGIEEKLPYLRDLGVICIYLSPIFSAYSNHKYDTADYIEIDPMFGSEEDFTHLCAEAKKMGIRIICDGVFSHTGADSVYFNRYGNYGAGGAYNDEASPYREWYYFLPDGNYESWWGIDDLPRVNKDVVSYREFINGVSARWLHAGASGWRLDVVDELPKSFLEELAASVKKAKPDALIVGEVWEDASRKSAYDERKHYFEGDKLDSVMNYPLRSAIMEFVRSGNAEIIKETVETQQEHYPPEVISCLMNILGTHDTERILTALGGDVLPEGAGRAEKAAKRMTEDQREKAVIRLKTAVLLQMTLPGVPCIYYGDEAETEGYDDPFNRRCFPWGHENMDLTEFYRKVIDIRRSHAAFCGSGYKTIIAENGLYAFMRYSPSAEGYSPNAGNNCDDLYRREDKEAAPNISDASDAGGNESDFAQPEGHADRIVIAANCALDGRKLSVPGKWIDLLTGEKFENEKTLLPDQGGILLPLV